VVVGIHAEEEFAPNEVFLKKEFHVRVDAVSQPKTPAPHGRPWPGRLGRGRFFVEKLKGFLKAAAVAEFLQPAAPLPCLGTVGFLQKDLNGSDELFQAKLGEFHPRFPRLGTTSWLILAPFQTRDNA